MTKKPAWLTAEGPEWKRGETREIYDNPWLKVTEIDAIAPTGKPALYGMVSFKNQGVGILPLHDDGSVTLVGQHRFTSGQYSWELPEGGSPLAEDPLASAKRELAEETGLGAHDWRQILTFDLSNSVTDERGFGYLATDLYPATGVLDDTEIIRLARVPFREALEAAVAGHMTDMMTVAILLRVYHMAREGELPSALTQAML